MPFPLAPPLLVLREDTGESWGFDAVTRIARDRRNIITDHPVESGVTVSDHARAEPGRESIAATVTATPFEGATWEQPVGAARLQAALDFLSKLRGVQLSLVFTDSTLEGYQLTSWSHERPNLRAIKFALEFREVVMVSAVVVNIPVTQPAPAAAAALPDKVDMGEQAMKDAPGSDATAASDQSWLHALLYGSEEEV